MTETLIYLILMLIVGAAQYLGNRNKKARSAAAPEATAPPQTGSLLEQFEQMITGEAPPRPQPAALPASEDAFEETPAFTPAPTFDDAFEIQPRFTAQAKPVRHPVAQKKTVTPPPSVSNPMVHLPPLDDPNRLREAIILYEILGPPKSLR